MSLSVDEGAEKIAKILTREEQWPAMQSPWLQSQSVVCKKERAVANAKKARSEMKEIKKEEESNPGSRICKTCGLPFAPYKHGCVHMPICKGCLGDKISEKRHGGLMAGMDARSGKIAIDFSDDSQLLDKLAQTAKRERRTLQQQVLYVLERWANP